MTVTPSASSGFIEVTIDADGIAVEQRSVIDDRFAMNQLPAVILGPGETAMAHKTDEYCVIPKIEEAVEIYAEIARRWMGY